MLVRLTAAVVVAVATVAVVAFDLNVGLAVVDAAAVAVVADWI